jgi:hypothetical protein
MRDAIGELTGRAAYEAKSIVAQYPSLAMPLARRRARRTGAAVLDETTDIVIEGFPRSGNTFAVAAFDFAQQGRVRIAHHIHAPAHVMAAVRAGVPALVLVREPEEAVLSYVVRRHIPIGQALRGYLRFYRPLHRYRKAFVVGTFEEVTTDFGTTIEAVNRRFGTRFREFEHTDENVRACLEAIDRDYLRFSEGGEALEEIVARPSPLRSGLKEELRARYRGAHLRRGRERAEQVFRLLRSPQ